MKFCGENTSNLTDLSINHVVNKVKLVKAPSQPCKNQQQHTTPLFSDEGLTHETLAFQIFYGGNSTIINAFEKANFHVSFSHRRSTTVSLETGNQFAQTVRARGIGYRRKPLNV